MAPFAAQAEIINIYGWQNYSWEFVDTDNASGASRSFDRISGNAANIGFAASVDTGMNGVHVNLQCESWTLHNHWHGNGGWCTRNSKIGLSHPQMGEIMFATWLLPYNEAVAQWIDPFYDAGSDSHTSIMGGVGGSSIYHSPGYWGNPRALGDGKVEDEGGTHVARDPRYAIGLDTGFNRRQEEIIQYFSPNWNGFKFRFAWTAGYEDENSATNGTDTAEVDPVIRSASIVYENGPLWLATTWQDHEDWTASRAGMKGTMTSSDSESFRLAGRYIFDLGDGMSVSLAAMWEDLEYEFNNVSNINDVLNAFYLLGFEATGNFDAELVRSRGKTRQNAADSFTDLNTLNGLLGTDLQLEDTDSDGTPDDPGTALTAEQISQIQSAIDALPESDDAQRETKATRAAEYDTFVSNAKNIATANTNAKVEREAWLVSGKIKFGGPVDFRFSYMDADDLEVSCSACSGDWDETAADAWNVGLFYTMPSGTELRLTYSEVNNDDNGSYAQGVSGTGYAQSGFESEMFAVGIVHWFD